MHFFTYIAPYSLLSKLVLDYELASHSHKLNNLHEFCWYKCEHAADSSIDQGHPLPSGLVALLP